MTGEEAEARLAELENALDWQTTCLACARVLSSSVQETERAEQAEERNAAGLALHPADTSNPHGPWCPTCMTAWPCATYRALAPARPAREDGDEP